MTKNPYPGKFIIFEGLDGSGLSTQASLLVDFLNKEAGKHFGQRRAHLTKEPTSGLIGGLINARLGGHWQSSPQCLQLLFSADRAFHLEKEIIPLLERGVTVISDRYLFSTLAFGSIGVGDLEWLINLQQKFLLPDITFFLRVSPKICMERIKANRFEETLYEKEEVLAKVWQVYEELAKRFQNIYIINGERPINEVAKEILTIVKERI